jgi:hypothetical protein
MAQVWVITSLRAGAYLGTCGWASCPRFVDMTFLGTARRSPAPQRWQNRCCHPSPTDALIGLKVRRRLG